MKTRCFWLLPFFFCAVLSGQSKNVNVRVNVKDATSSHALSNSILRVNGVNFSTDVNGMRLLRMPQNKTFTLCAHSLGFADTCATFIVYKDTLITLTLRPKKIKLDEITVSAAEVQNKQPEENEINLSEHEVFLKPSLLADKDLLGGIQQLQGVNGGIDGFVGLYVRGGNLDQNLILLDGIPIYNVYHTFGLFSALPVNGIQQVGLYQSGLPAKYGGKLSSVLDVSLVDGNMKEWHGNATGGLISASGFVEGPIIKDKLSLQIGVRKTWLDIIVRAIDGEQFGGTSIPGFGDYHFKSTYTINQHHKLSIVAYFNRDYFLNSGAFSESTLGYSKSKQQYGNTLGGLTHEWNKGKILSKTQLSLTSYFFKNTVKSLVNESVGSYYLEEVYKNKLNALMLQNQTTIQWTSAIAMQMGAQLLKNNLSMPQFTSTTWPNEHKNSVLTDTSFGQVSQKMFQVNPYLAFLVEKNNWFVNLGVRSNLAFGENGNNYSVDPRLFVSKVFANGKLKGHASFDVMHQPIQEVRLSRMSLPTDYWSLFNENLPVAKSIGGELGISFIVKQLDISAVVFKKKMENVFERLESNYLYYNQPVTDLVAPAQADIHGISLQFTYKAKRLTASAGYTYQSSMRQSDAINNGVAYEFEFNQPNMVKTTGAILLKNKGEKRVEFSWFWYWASGLPFTYSPSAIPVNPAINGQAVLPYAAEKNNFRTPQFHRLDVSFRFMKQKKKGLRTFEIVFYNVYSHINTFYLSTNFDGQPEVQGTLPFLPMFSYSYDF